MEEYVKALEEGNYQEARAGFQKIYDSTHSIIAFYYLTMIDYKFNGLKVNELLSRFEYLYGRGNPQIREKILPIYLTILLFEVDDFKKALDISKREYNNGNRNCLVCFSYGYASHVINKDNSDSIISLIEEGLMQEDVNPQFKLVGYEIIVKIYLARNEINKAKQILGKLTLILPQEERLHFINLMINLKEDDTSLDEDSLDVVLNSMYIVEFANYISHHFFDKKDYENCIKYIDLVLSKTGHIDSLVRQKAICFATQGLYDKAIELIRTNNMESYDNLYLLSQILYFKGNKEALNEALEINNKVSEKGVNPLLLRSTGDIYVRLQEFDKVKEVITSLKEKFPKDPYYHVLNAHIYINEKEFNKAEKEIKEVENKVMNENIAYIAHASYKKPEKSFFLYKKLTNEDNHIRLLSKFYGEFGVKKQDYQEDFEILDSNKEESCDYSLLGTILLENNQVEKAIEYFKIGKDRYLNKQNRCPCALVSYAYCLFKGYGINQNYQEAYDLLKDIIINDKKEITDNLVCLYAELSIALNLDLNEVYNFLEQTINRRYSCSRYFTLIKLGKLIDKDIKKYEKLYKKSIKFASEKEREYYLNNPNEFMMNNN